MEDDGKLEKCIKHFCKRELILYHHCYVYTINRYCIEDS